MAANAPHINIYDSFLHYFDFTPREVSALHPTTDLRIAITRVEDAVYILQYRRGYTFESAYRVSRTPDQWEVQQIDLSPTTIVHDCHVDKIEYTYPPLEDKNYNLPLTPIPVFHSFMQVAGVVAIGAAGYGAKAQFQYKRPLLGVICVLVSIAYAVVMVFIRHRSKQVALDMARRLIYIVDTVNAVERKAPPSGGYSFVAGDYQ